jgi:hypothetical protein
MAKPKPPKPAAAPPAATAGPPPRTLDAIDVGRGQARLKALREKFGRALDDPDLRAALVRYIRSLLHENGKAERQRPRR